MLYPPLLSIDSFVCGQRGKRGNLFVCGQRGKMIFPTSVRHLSNTSGRWRGRAPVPSSWLMIFLLPPRGLFFFVPLFAVPGYAIALATVAALIHGPATAWLVRFSLRRDWRRLLLIVLGVLRRRRCSEVGYLVALKARESWRLIRIVETLS